jgi:hypothetical protein
MPLRFLLSALAAALVLVLAACGGDEGAATGTESAAGIAPADAALYASIDTDFESDQWRQAQELLDRFPGKSRLLALINEGLADEDLDFERDIRPALGPTVEIIVLDFEDENDVVLLTKPDDEERFEALLDKADEPVYRREIEGWTAVAQSEAALARLEQAAEEASLEEADRFSDAMGRLPAEALAKVFVNGERATEALQDLQRSTTIPERFGRFVAASAALEAEGDGFRLSGFVRQEDAEVDPPDLGALVEEVPATAWAFINFHGYDGQLGLTEQFRSAPELQQPLTQVERFLGVTLDDISTLFNREGIIWVAPGPLIPEVTLVLTVDDEQRALRTIDQLAQRASGLGASAPQPRRVGNVDAKQVSFGQFSLLYAAFDGHLVVTTQANGIAALASGGDKLVDADHYQEALDAAGVEQGEDVVLYFDLEKTVDIAEQLAQLADEPLPADVRANLEPLRALVGATSLGKEDSTFRIFVQIE